MCLPSKKLCRGASCLFCQKKWLQCQNTLPLFCCVNETVFVNNIKNLRLFLKIDYFCNCNSLCKSILFAFFLHVH